MWTLILSLDASVDELKPAFTRPGSGTGCELLLAWVMCLGKYMLRRMAHYTAPQVAPDHCRGLDTYHNYFERSAWTPKALAHRVALLVFTRIQFLSPITLLIDDRRTHQWS